MFQLVMFVLTFVFRNNLNYKTMEIKNFFNDRRSVNFFDKTRKLDMQTLQNIIDLAVMAPSAFNLQPWRVLIIQSEEAKNKLLSLANNQPKVVEASANLVLVGNKKGWSASNPVWEEMLQSVGGNKDIVSGAQQAAAYLYGSSPERELKFAESNTGLLAMSLMIAAKEYGVDTHPMSGIDFDGIHREFGLNEDETVVMSIAVGYFDHNQTLYPRRPRRNFSQIASIH